MDDNCGQRGPALRFDRGTHRTDPVDREKGPVRWHRHTRMDPVPGWEHHQRLPPRRACHSLEGHIRTRMLLHIPEVAQGRHQAELRNKAAACASVAT